MSRFELTVDLDDDEMVLHLVKALSAHLRWCWVNRIPPPVTLLPMTNRLKEWVKMGQGGSRVHPLDVAGDDAGVTTALLLSLPEAAAQLGVSLSTMKRLVGNGTVPVVDVNGVRRVRRSDLVDYVNELGGDRSWRDDLSTKTTAEA